MAGSKSPTVGERLAILTERIEAQGSLFSEIKMQLSDIGRQLNENERSRHEFRVQYTSEMSSQNNRIGAVEISLANHAVENQNQLAAVDAALTRHVEDDKPKWEMVGELKKRIEEVIKAVNNMDRVIAPLKWASVLLGGALILWGFDRAVELFSK